MLALPRSLSVALLLALSSLVLADESGVDVEVNVLDDYEAGSRFANAGDHETALRMFRQCSEEGDPRCDFSLATYYHLGDGGIAVNPDEAFRLAKQSADRGFAPGEFFLFVLYKDGVGAEADPELAREYLVRAANGCEVTAQEFLAFDLIRSDDPEDILSGAAWLSVAMENGSTDAPELLGALLEGVSDDVVARMARIAAQIQQDLDCADGWGDPGSSP